MAQFETYGLGAGEPHKFYIGWRGEDADSLSGEIVAAYPSNRPELGIDGFYGTDGPFDSYDEAWHDLND